MNSKDFKAETWYFSKTKLKDASLEMNLTLSVFWPPKMFFQDVQLPGTH